METEINIPNFYYDPEYNTYINLYFKIDRSLFEKICSDLFLEALRPVDNIMNDNDMDITEIDEIILVGGSTRIPKIKFMLHNYFNKPPNCSLSPDYAIAAGAAIQGYMISNSDDPFCKNMVLLDVIPLSLGIESNNGQMSVIIPRNSNIPTRKTQRYTTEKDYQDKVIINVYEGERKMVNDNFHVGSFILSGIIKEKKGIPDIRVTINVDVNGIINITAIDNKSNIQNKLTISGNKRRLTEQQISQMVKEAEINEKEDNLKQLLINNYYKFIDIYDMIKFNINDNIECKFNNTDKNNISNELEYHMDYFENIIKNYKFKLKLYRNSDDKDKYENCDIDISCEKSQLKLCDELKDINSKYKSKLDIIEKKYQSFIIKMDNHNDNTNIETANLYNQKTSEINTNNILDDELNNILDDELNNIPDNKQELKRLNIDDDEMTERKELIRICDQAENILETLSDDNAKKLEDYLYKTIMWMNLNIQIPKDDYIKKIEEINLLIDNIKIINDKEENNTYDINENHKDKLIKLCQIMKTNIEANKLPFDNTKFDNLIYDTIQWINNSNLNHDNEIYYQKIKQIEMLYIDCYKN
jgi:hypothetical protein